MTGISISKTGCLEISLEIRQQLGINLKMQQPE